MFQIKQENIWFPLLIIIIIIINIIIIIIIVIAVIIVIIIISSSSSSISTIICIEKLLQSDVLSVYAQLGINQHSHIFQRQQIELASLVQFYVSLWNIYLCWLIPNCTAKHLITRGYYCS